MKKEYNFSKGKVRKPPIADNKTTKVQTSIRLDYEVMEWSQKEADRLGAGYQTFLNMKLKESMGHPSLEKRVSILEKKFSNEPNHTKLF